MKKYWPLICLILIAALSSAAISLHLDLSARVWMHHFMGIFFCIFAMLKLFNPSQFADGFAMYDLLGKRSRSYALIYPFIELVLGLGYLSFWHPPLVYIATIIVMVFGALGVFKALSEGINIRCACMGTVLDVPLSTVTLTEDIGMSVMAAFLLFS